MWKKTPYENWRDEQHITFDEDTNNKLEKMFSNKTKQPRYIPDDPYEKYNRNVNYWKYHFGLLKNKELIRKYGNPVYRFNRYKAHIINQSDKNIKSPQFYAPPGYLQTVGDNIAGVYKPDPALEPPKIETAPHFQRNRIQFLKKRPYGKRGRPLPRWYKEMRDYEMYLDKPIPLWSPINFPTKHMM